MDQILRRGAPVPLGGFLHILNLSKLGPRFDGVTFTLKRAEGFLHGEDCLQDVQIALCTSAIRWCANLYTYIGLMVPVCSEWYVSVPFLCNLGPKAALPRNL